MRFVYVNGSLKEKEIICKCLEGAIEKGLAADLVVLDGNPLDDISALKKVEAVYQDGKKVEI